MLRTSDGKQIKDEDYFDDDEFADKEIWRFDERFSLEFLSVCGKNSTYHFKQFLLAWSPYWFVTDDNRFRPRHLSHLCEFGATNCLKVLLGGFVDWKVELNAFLPDGTYPIHLATRGFEAETIKLLIRHGARTDSRTKGIEVKEGFLALNIAVENTCRHKYLKNWNANDSVLKLMVLLCLPEMKFFLDVIALLAERTDETVDELMNYIEHGKIVQMTVLFIAARKQNVTINLFRSCVYEDARFVTVERERLESLNDTIMDFQRMKFRTNPYEEFKKLYRDNNKAIRRLNQKKKALASARLLLAAFEKIGNDMDEYLRTKHLEVSQKEVIEHVTSLLKHNGFLLEENCIELSKLECYHWFVDKRYYELLGITELSHSQHHLYVSLKLAQMVTGDNKQKRSSSKILRNWHISRFLPTINDEITSVDMSTFRIPSFEVKYIGCNEISHILAMVNERSIPPSPMPPSPMPPSPMLPSSMLSSPSHQSIRAYGTAASMMMKVLRRI